MGGQGGVEENLGVVKLIIKCLEFSSGSVPSCVTLRGEGGVTPSLGLSFHTWKMRVGLSPWISNCALWSPSIPSGAPGITEC